MSSMKNQLTFTGASDCVKFVVNRAKLNMKNGEVSCVDCYKKLEDHKHEAVTDDDVVMFLNHLEAKTGANVMFTHVGNGKIFLGGKESSVNPFVEQNHVRGVVNASNLHLSTRSDYKKWAQKVVDLEKEGTLEVIRLGWDDEETSQKIWKDQPYDQLEQCLVFIETHLMNGNNVVIHCAQGKSRSGTVFVAYMMMKKKMTYVDALAYAKSKRNIVQPNTSFEKQLIEFERSSALKDLREKFGEE